MRGIANSPAVSKGGTQTLSPLSTLSKDELL